MNQYGMITKVVRRTKQTLLPGATNKMLALLEELGRTEPREWKEGTYQKLWAGNGKCNI